MMKAILALCFLSCSYAFERLSRDSYPLRYHLSLWPDMRNLTYQGKLSILMVMNDTNKLSLDCEGLIVTNTSMMFDDSIVVQHDYSQNASRLTVTTNYVMRAAYKVELNISFSGTIRNDLTGFYWSKYLYNGTQRYLGSTQFESTSARKVFPCFDEPSFKANFSLEMNLEPTWSAISNTPITSDVISGQIRTIRFAERPSIPTFLIGWVVYEDAGFGSTSVQSNSSCGSSIRYTVWSNKAYQTEHEIALPAAHLLVETLEDFTGVQCKTVKDKVDLVAVPDFAAGAMENWAIITFRESNLLYNNMYSTALDMQRIITIVAHELVHQWFGNLVTPEWWSYIWLSEGFARYLQYFIPHKAFPNLRLAEQFLVETRQSVLNTDSSSAHPLTNNNVSTQTEIDEMFGSITYDKGASVIHMISSLLGPEEFSKGINRYLTTVDNSGGITTPDKFFSSFPTLPALMREWSETSGYPVIIASERNSTLSLRQIKITSWNVVNDSHWLVPISININGNESWHYLEPNKTLELTVLNSDKYIINGNQTGYYRVMYTNSSRWEAVDVNPVTRSQLIDDSMYLVHAGLLPFSVAIPATFYHLNNCLDYLTWKTGLRTLSSLHVLLDGSELQSQFTGQILSEMARVIDYIAFNETENMQLPMKLHQMNILKHACMFGHKGCLAAADELALNISGSSPDKRSAIMCKVVERGNETIWEEILEKYKTARSPSEQQHLLSSLACTTNRTLINRLLSILFTEDVKKQDITSTISNICGTRPGTEETFAYFKKNLTDIYNYFGESKSIRKILSSMSKFINESQLSELKELSKSFPQFHMDTIILSTEKSISRKRNTLQQLNAFLRNEPEPTDKPTITTSSPAITTVQPTSHGSSFIPNKMEYMFILSALVFYLSGSHK